MIRRAWRPFTALLLAGCATIYNPATQRQETVISTPIESALGTLARVQMGLTSLTVGRISEEERQRVQRIGAQIAQVSDRQDIRYQFGVIREKSINAFTLPGGTIYVHTGTLDKATDDELAAVIGHEIGHVAARHVAKHLQADIGFDLLLQAAQSAGAGAESVRVVNSLYGLFSRGFSRRDELEADQLAIRYTQRAGFDPGALVTFFEKMEKENPENAMKRALVWQATHPLTSDRVEQAKKELAKLSGIRFCPVCGREYPSATRFCSQDGASLKEKRQR